MIEKIKKALRFIRSLRRKKSQSLEIEIKIVSKKETK